MSVNRKVSVPTGREEARDRFVWLATGAAYGAAGPPGPDRSHGDTGAMRVAGGWMSPEVIVSTKLGRAGVRALGEHIGRAPT